MSAPPRVLVAGVGNVLLTDDGFGVEVVGRLARQPLPPGVVVRDYGIRGLHLAYALVDGPELLIVVDAIDRGEPPGTLLVVQLDSQELASHGSGATPDPHAMNVSAVLASVAVTVGAMGATLPRVLIVGCQPASLDEGLGLSPAVARAINPALDLVRDILNRELSAAASAVEKETIDANPA